jgi:hypothetical protein
MIASFGFWKGCSIEMVEANSNGCGAFENRTAKRSG